MESRHPYAERHLAKAGVARCKGRGLPTLGEQAQPERKGRSEAEVCTLGTISEREREAAHTVQQVLVVDQMPITPEFSVHSVYKPFGEVE
jgi:hypothetical protein